MDDKRHYVVVAAVGIVGVSARQIHMLMSTMRRWLDVMAVVENAVRFYAIQTVLLKEVLF